MPTISFHAPPALYKKFATAARRRRVNPSQFARVAVEEKLASAETNKPASEMRRLAVKLQNVIDDEVAVRIAEERLARLDRGESRTYAGEEVWRALGLQD